MHLFLMWISHTLFDILAHSKGRSVTSSVIGIPEIRPGFITHDNVIIMLMYMLRMLVYEIWLLYCTIIIIRGALIFVGFIRLLSYTFICQQKYISFQ